MESGETRRNESPKVPQILKAATDVFMEEGYGAASMDRISQRAGVSKATVYAHFEGKEQLFAAIVSAECRRHSEGMSAPDVARLPVAEALTRIARDFLEFVTMPQTLRAFRVVVAESQRFPELGRIFYHSGPELTSQRLAAYLRDANERGQLRVPDPLLTAEQFLGMVHGHIRLRCLLRVTEKLSREEIERVVHGAVDMLLRAYGPDER